MSKKYSSELKLEVVRKKLSGESTVKLVSEYNLSHKSIIYQWLNQYKNGNTTFEETRGKATKQESNTKGRKKIVKREDMTDAEYIKYLEMEVDILKKISEVKASTGSNKYLIYKVIVELVNKYPVSALCLYLDAFTSTYYLYLKRNPQKYDLKIMELVVNHKKIIRIMHYLNILGKQYRRKYNFNKVLHKSKTFDNVLPRNFKCNKSNEKWSIDITYVPDKRRNTI